MGKNGSKAIEIAHSGRITSYAMSFRSPFLSLEPPMGVSDVIQSLCQFTKTAHAVRFDSKPVLKTDLKKNSLKIAIEFDRKLYTNETNPAAPLWATLKRSNGNNNLDAMA